MSLAMLPDDTIFEHFTVFEETYKTVGSHEIKAAILIPKTLTSETTASSSSPRPVIFNVHGGFLTFGHALFSPFFSPWVMKLALEERAILVSADHRLLPSPNDFQDVLDDLEDFWQWAHRPEGENGLASALTRHAEKREGGLPSYYKPDFSRLLLTGQSAGGYCVTQLALSHPDEVSAVAMAYPFVDPKDPLVLFGPQPGESSIMKMPESELASREEVLKWVKETREGASQAPVSRASWERLYYSAGSAQHGLFHDEVLNPRGIDNPDWYPLERIEKRGARLPKNVWILHGDDDTIVHIRASRKLIDLVNKKFPADDAGSHTTTIRLDVGKGEDHAFDLQKTWWELHAIGGLDFVKRSWLRLGGGGEEEEKGEGAAKK